MIRRISAFIASFSLCLLLGGLVSVGNQTSAHAETPSPDKPCPTHDFLGIPPWYKYLQLDPGNDCHPTVNFDQNPEDIWKIGAAFIEILLRIGGFIVVVWIILTGFMFMTSNGNPDAVKQVRNRLIYAGVGLAIIILSASAVSFIGRRLTRASPSTSTYESRILT